MKIQQLLQDIQRGKRVFVATDSKTKSKQLANQCYRLGLQHDQVLLINSETIGSEPVQAFLTNPDVYLAKQPQIQAVIASPSMLTGTSIETDSFNCVYGLFWGVSLTDAEMAQALLRVRSQVPRVVWCAKRGSNFCSFSKASQAGELLDVLKKRTDAEVLVLKESLREALQGEITAIAWRNNPHLRLFAQITAETNNAMWNLRPALLARLCHEGHVVTCVDLESDSVVQTVMKASREQMRQLEAEAIANARLLTPVEKRALAAKEALTSVEQLSLMKSSLAEFYCTEQVTPELVLEDKAGLQRSHLLALEQQLDPSLATQRDLSALERQMQWQHGLCAWDLPIQRAKQVARSLLNLDWYLNPEVTWTRYDNAKVANFTRQYAADVKRILGLGNLDKLSDTHIVHQLLSQLGVKLTFTWSSFVPGHEGEKLRVYRLDQERWQEQMGLLERRAARREPGQSLTEAGSPPAFNNKETEGSDPLQAFSAFGGNAIAEPITHVQLDTSACLKPLEALAQPNSQAPTAPLPSSGVGNSSVAADGKALSEGIACPQCRHVDLK